MDSKQAIDAARRLATTGVEDGSLVLGAPKAKTNELEVHPLRKAV